MARKVMNLNQKEVDRVRMLAPGKWPRWPWLPLKRRSHGSTEMPELGLLHADDTTPDRKPRVYFVNLYSGLAYWPKESYPFKEYENIDAILADGWIID